MSSKVIAFPQLGDYQFPIKKLLKNLTHLPVLDIPPITKNLRFRPGALPRPSPTESYFK